MVIRKEALIMSNGQEKVTGKILLTVLLIGTVTLTGCNAIPSFSSKIRQYSQVAQADTAENLQDVSGESQDQNSGGKSGSQSGEDKEGNADPEGKGSDSMDGEQASDPSQSPRIPVSDPQSGPSPQPAPPGTPIRPFYELAGSPPTAPGLAMKFRNFKTEPAKIAYLTIDDGPSDNTVRILKILKDEEVRATFFVIGRQVERYPELLKQEYEQGNAIGNHTYSHNYAEIYKDPDAYMANIKKNEELIYNLVGIRPKIIRTPGGTQGHFHISYYNAVDAQDYLVYDWNVSTGDAAAPLVPAKQIVANVMNQVPGKNRVIILMHDAPGKTTTPDALPQIIQFLKKQGYEFGVLTPEVAPILFPGGFRV
jgi:peptidoglycan-N-acetylglucosamine deacetylase